MRLRVPCFVLMVLFLASAVDAQTRPVFDPDDSVDPRQHDVPLLSLRLVAGAAWDFVDEYRPLDENVGFVHFAGSVYFRRVQFDYKHSEILGDDPGPVSVCACDPPVFFPTPPPANATPDPPPAGSKDSLQAAWYLPKSAGGARIPVMLRYRVHWSRQRIDTEIGIPGTNEIVSRRTGLEQSFGFEGDTHFRVRGHDLFGLVQFARASRRKTVDDRSQNVAVYTHRFPGTAYRKLLFRSTLSIGAISDRGGTTINLVNPYLEAFVHHHKSGANFHVVWSPQTTNSGVGGWKTTHQIAVFVDRGIVIPLGKR
jgi:hypothetical protein